MHHPAFPGTDAATSCTCPLLSAVIHCYQTGPLEISRSIINWHKIRNPPHGASAIVSLHRGIVISAAGDTCITMLTMRRRQPPPPICDLYRASRFSVTGQWNGLPSVFCYDYRLECYRIPTFFEKIFLAGKAGYHSKQSSKGVHPAFPGYYKSYEVLQAPHAHFGLTFHSGFWKSRVDQLRPTTKSLPITIACKETQ